MIKHVHIENFKCFKEFDIDLDPLTVLVGPNDSGKTTCLEAIGTLAVAGAALPLGQLDVRKSLNLANDVPRPWFDSFGEVMALAAEGTDRETQEPIDTVRLELRAGAGAWEPTTSEKVKVSRAECQAVRDSLVRMCGRPAFLRLRPDAIRRPSAISANADITLSGTGAGLPTFLENLLREDLDAYLRIKDAYFKRFGYELNIPKQGKNNVIRFKVGDGLVLSPQSVSDGAMLYLGFLVLAQASDKPGIVLIEEPENGVHPASLASIVSFMKDMSEEGTQVILTTHSPYLLDEVEPEQVRVFAKMEDGSVQARRLSDYPDVERMKKHFETGEIWTEFDEAEIVKGKAGH